MRLPNEPEVEGEINLVPMIDVIFFILAVFILSSVSLIRSEGLPVDLPSGKTAEPQQVTQFNITVEPDGDIFLDRKPIQLEALKQQLETVVKPTQDNLVIINADKTVEHGRVVQVMDTVRQVKGAKLAIAAKKQ